MIIANIDSNPEFINQIVEILKHTAEITYYLSSSTKAWYNIVSFVESNMFLLTAGLGLLVGYIFGSYKRGQTEK